MTTIDFITDLFYRIDDRMQALREHPQAVPWPSEVVTLGVLHALKGVGNRAFYRWLTRDYQPLFPHLPERTRLFRQFKIHQQWTLLSLALPTLLGVVDSYSIELIHPIREGRRPAQIGRKGLSNHRWIVGVKLCLLVNHRGEVVGWPADPANVRDTWFHPLIQLFQDRMIVLADSGFHARDGDPPHLKLCPRGTWNDRMLIETVFSMLTLELFAKLRQSRTVITTLLCILCKLTHKLCYFENSSLISHFKKVMHRVIDYVLARLASTVAAFNLLIQWDGLQPDKHGFVSLPIVEFSL